MHKEEVFASEVVEDQLSVGGERPPIIGNMPAEIPKNPSTFIWKTRIVPHPTYEVPKLVAESHRS
jgi:hypothetical protein